MTGLTEQPLFCFIAVLHFEHNVQSPTREKSPHQLVCIKYIEIGADRRLHFALDFEC